MTYFNYYHCTPDQGLREAINYALANECVTNDGFIKQSNYMALEKLQLKSLVPTSTKYVLGNLWSYGDTFMLSPKVTSADLKEIIDCIEWLTENCLLDEGIYSDLVSEEVDKQLTSIANDYHVDPEVLIDLFRDSDYYSYEENGDIYLDIKSDDLDALIDEARTISQTEHAHYYGGQYHSPKHCPKCQEFPDLVGARATEEVN